jgi:orotate phosphoribosyltransferase
MQDTEIANFLLDIKAFRINVNDPFVWTSGIKSPIYCDCRLINSYVSVRNVVINRFIDLITKNFLYKTDVIAGVASGGISYGAVIADRLKLPFIYVRERKKEHGLMKQIEGEYNEASKIILIEDHISTGGSSMNAIRAIKDAGLEIVCLLSIMTYGFKKAESNFNSEGVEHKSLCDLDTVLRVASQKEIVSARDRQEILQFREDPDAWK